MKKLSVVQSGLSLTMHGPVRNETLAIRGSYPQTSSSLSLFASLGTMHMIAPYMPRTVETNFFIPGPIRELIGAMYASCKKSVPEFRYAQDVWLGPVMTPSETPRVVIAYSAGKDSMWNLMRAIDRYGQDNVLVIHIRGLNRNNGKAEYAYTLRQQAKFPFRHLEIIDLCNSSTNTGYATMRSRDMFLAGLCIPPALKFGASQIVTEGFEEETADEPFTGLEKNMRYFNRILTRLGVPIQVTWQNQCEQSIVKDLYRHRPEWMPHVCNCFTIPYRQGFFKKKVWGVKAPTFPLYDSQCGSCVKCRVINLARLEMDPAMQKIALNDIRYFLVNTDHWLCDPRVQRDHMDMITPSFMRDFHRACRKYGIVAKATVKNYPAFAGILI